MSERWRPIPGFAGYEASDLGRVRSSMRYHGSTEPRILKLTQRKGRWPGTTGYLRVSLSRSGHDRQAHRPVHQLVLAAFVGPRPVGMVSRHLNGVKTDNRLENLRYGTPAENNADTIAHGGNPYSAQTHCKHGHEFTPENTRVDSRIGRTGKRLYLRSCRTCLARREKARVRRPRAETAA